MGIFDVNYTFDNLIRLTSAGVEVSSFVQIKNALIKRYKEIYGNDIDLSDASGDGQQINSIALMLYNGFNAIYYLNQNFDPASASGKFLDILSGLSNVFRKGATNSTAYLYVKYTGTLTEYYSVLNPSDNIQQIQCVDHAGRIWTWTEGKGTDTFKTVFKAVNEFDPETLKPKVLLFTCEDDGAIEASAESELVKKTKNAVTLEDLTRENHGDIYMTIDPNTFPFEVWQASDAVVGENEESDEALKRRRLAQLGNAGLTVINGLIGSLLAVEGIVDVKLYSNVKRNINSGLTPLMDAKDGSKINFHDLYLCLRYKEGVEPDKSIIGKIIHEKNTPGIVTTPFNSGISEGENPEYKICLESPYGWFQNETISVYSNILEYDIFWKKCKPIAPSMRLNFMYNTDIYIKEVQEEIIKNAIKKFTFNLSIYDNLNIANVLAAINQSDTPVNNQNNFFFISGMIEKPDGTTGLYSGNQIPSSPTAGSTVTYFGNKDTYYSYNDDTNIKFYFDYTGTSDGQFKTATLDIYQLNMTVSVYEYTGTIIQYTDHRYTWKLMKNITKPKDAQNQITLTVGEGASDLDTTHYIYYTNMNLTGEIPVGNKIISSLADCIIYAKPRS